MDVNHPPWIQGEGLFVCGGVCAARRGDIGDLQGLKEKGW